MSLRNDSVMYTILVLQRSFFLPCLGRQNCQDWAFIALSMNLRAVTAPSPRQKSVGVPTLLLFEYQIIPLKPYFNVLSLAVLSFREFTLRSIAYESV